MKLAVVILTLSVVSNAAVWAELFGPCVERCGLGDQGCDPGYECRSNGCGHTCQPGPGLDTRTICDFQPCGIFCPFGRKVVNGCTLCECNRDF